MTIRMAVSGQRLADLNTHVEGKEVRQQAVGGDVAWTARAALSIVPQRPIYG